MDCKFGYRKPCPNKVVGEGPLHKNKPEWYSGPKWQRGEYIGMASICARHRTQLVKTLDQAYPMMHILEWKVRQSQLMLAKQYAKDAKKRAKAAKVSSSGQKATLPSNTSTK